MALVRRSSSFEKRPWKLKDYLGGDDMSSCSSNGFRSFPRKQCCVAVCNIIENEVINRNTSHLRAKKPPKRIIVKSDCSSLSSALHRASMAVVNAVKLIPFNSPPKTEEKKRFLPRSFSKKLFRRTFFWKKRSSKNDCYDDKKKKKREEYIDEIERWISSGAVGKEKYQPLDLSNDTTVTKVSNSTMSNSNSNSDGKSVDSSWSDITFTSDSTTSFSENDDVERREKLEDDDDVSKRAAAFNGQDSVEPPIDENEEENMWVNNEEAKKEHTSPTSVLDFPDDDEDSSSPFTHGVPRIKSSKERLMKKLGRFDECLVGLEPVSLESLLSSPDLDDQSSKCSIQSCSTPSYIVSSVSEEEQEEDDDEEGEDEVYHESEIEKHAQYLLYVTKANVTTPPPKLTTDLDNVMLDYFRENVTQKGSHALLKAAEDWLNGHYDNLMLGWEVKDKRQAYIRDMEEGGWWPRDTKLEREEVESKLGDEVVSHLIEELMVEFCSS